MADVTLKSGALTTEFYGHLAVTAIGLFLASGVIALPGGTGGDLSQILGGAMAVLSQGTYTFSRASLKAAAINAAISAAKSFEASFQAPISAPSAPNPVITAVVNPVAKIGFVAPSAI